jgi:hypothetical protein
MRILILEDDTFRINYFIEKFCNHNLTITESADSAIEYLQEDVFDYIFLDNDLGDGVGCGADVAAYLYNNLDNPNNDSIIIVHSWNIPAVAAMKNKLPQAVFVPFGSEGFYELDID